MPRQTILIGTSGFSYDEWKGSFYPEKLKSKEYLAHYAGTFPTTEINNTFYRTPSARTVAGWAEQTPDDFRFALKLMQRVTHKKRLQDVDEEMEWFRRGVEPLEGRLAAVLVQLPPWFRYNPDVLESFLSEYAAKFPLAFEFRHRSWLDENVAVLLERYGATLVLAETDETPAPKLSVGPFRYVRLRKTDYEPAELESWSEWVKRQAVPSVVYFKHSNRAPVLAEAFQKMIGGT